jgi:hypothetical protein
VYNGVSPHRFSGAEQTDRGAEPVIVEAGPEDAELAAAAALVAGASRARAHAESSLEIAHGDR